MINSIGIRAHDFGKMKSKALVEAVRSNDLRSVQLALNKAISGIEEIDQRLTQETLFQIGKEFNEEQVKIAVLGCYLNYAHPDTAIRNKNMDTFMKHIEYAPILNARVVGTETGSMNADYTYCKENHTKDAYKTFAKSLASILEYAEAKNVMVAVECVWNHIIYDNKQMYQLINDMGSKHLRVILDPVNLLNHENYINHNKIVNQAFELFGDRIDVVHVKDYVLENQKIIEMKHGRGIYAFDFLMNEIKASNNQIDVLLENTDVADIGKVIKLLGDQ